MQKISKVSVLHSVEFSGFFCHSDFYVKSILGESGSSKTAFFADFEALNFVDLVIFSLSKRVKL